MNKAAFVLAVEDITGHGVTATTEAVNAMLQVLVHTVASGEAVAITGLGRLEPVIRDARTARNPATGATIEVPDKFAIRFKAADRFKAYTNGDIELPKKAADVDLKALPAPAVADAP